MTTNLTDERQIAQEILREHLEEATALIADVRSSRSGMSARVRVMAVTPKGPVSITGAMADVAGMPLSDDGVLVRGYGVDHFSLLLHRVGDQLGLGYARECRLLIITSRMH